MPLLVQRGEHVPHVRVLTDRTGADLEGVAARAAPRRRQVRGSETFPLRKVHPGGWSDRRYDQAAEETWKRNAQDVSAAATELAETEVDLEHGIGAVLRYADASTAAS
jgi:hypothetical protein